MTCLKTIILLTIILLAAALRFSSLSYNYSNPDEIISVKVAELVSTTNVLDTNWKNADLPEYFKYSQYNFSGYILSAAGIIKLAHIISQQHEFSTIGLLRIYSSILGIVVVALTFLLGRQLFNINTGLSAAFITASSPLLYQDSLYARPETFVTVLTLLYVYVSGCIKLKLSIRVLLATAILGLLIATKISQLALLPIIALSFKKEFSKNKNYISAALDYLKTSLKWSLKLIPLALMGMIIGFIIGAPYAVSNLLDFKNGILVLNQQYSIGTWPHGVPDGNFYDRLVYSLNFFTSTSGVGLIIFSIIGYLSSLKKRKYRAFFIFTLISLFAILFSTYPTFFERNFSNILPIFIIFSASGINFLIKSIFKRIQIISPLTVIVLLIVTSPGIQTSLRLRMLELPGASLKNTQKMREKLEHENGVTAVQLGFIQNYPEIKEKINDKCRPSLIEFSYPGDKYSIKIVERLKFQDGYKEVGFIPSVFENIPASTLRTYFTPTKIFLYREDINFKDCKAKNHLLVSRKFVGAPINILDSYTDRNWTPHGAYGEQSDPLIANQYFGSWSGADANKGKFRVKITNTMNSFVLPYITGPSAHDQSIIVTDEDTGAVIWNSGILEQTTKWKFLFIPVPEVSHKIIITAVDNGAEWGEWLAVSTPRFLTGTLAAQ